MLFDLRICLPFLIAGDVVHGSIPRRIILFLRFMECASLIFRLPRFTCNTVANLTVVQATMLRSHDVQYPSFALGAVCIQLVKFVVVGLTQT